MGAIVSHIAMGLIASIVPNLGLTIVLFISPIIFSLAAGAGLIVLGSVAAMIGCGLFTGGLYVYWYSIFSENATWTEFGKLFLNGFTLGCVTCFFSLVASSIIAPLAAILGVTSFAENLIIAGILGSLTSLGANTFANWMNGNDLCKNWNFSIFFGALLGMACQALVLKFTIDHMVDGHIQEIVIDNFDEFTQTLLRQVNWAAAARHITQHSLAVNLVKAGEAVVHQLIALLAYNPSEEVSSNAPSSRRQIAPATTGQNPTQPEGDNSSEEDLEEISDEPTEDSFLSEKTEEDAEEKARKDNANLTAADRTTIDLGNVAAEPDALADSRSIEPTVQCFTHAPDDDASPQERLSNEKRLKLEESPLLARVPYSETNPLPSDEMRFGQIVTEHLASQETQRWSETPDEKFVTTPFELFNLHAELQKEQENARKVQVQKKEIVEVFVGDGQKVGVPVQGSSSYPSTSTHSASLNEKTKKSNDKKAIPDSLEAESEEGFKTFACTNNIKLQPPDKKRLATVHKLVAYSYEENKYVLTAKKEWPIFEDSMQVVTFMGVPGSGKTSLIHCLLMRMGYAITEIQATLTRLRIGVNAYVLTEDRLVIIECCEGIDPADIEWIPKESNSNIPYAGLLIELFCYVCTSSIFFVVPFFKEETDKIKEYIQNRLYTLFSCGIAIKMFEQKDVNLILRVERETDSNKRKADEIQDSFRSELEGPGEECRKDTSNKSMKEDKKNKVLATNRIVVKLMRTFELQSSFVDIEEYGRHLGNILHAVGGRKKELFMTSDNLFSNMRKLWKILQDSQIISTVVAKLHAEKVTKANDGENYGTEAFFKQLNEYTKLLRKSKHKHFCAEIEQYSSEIKIKGKELSKNKNEAESAELFVRSIIWISEILVRRSLEVTDLKLKPKGIEIGLEGFLLLLKAGANATVIEVYALRMSLFDYNVLNLLAEPTVYSNYSECWFLLKRFARSGFKLPIMAFPLWKAFSEISQKTELNKNDIPLYREMLNLLLELTNQNIDYCMPREKNTRFENSDIYGNVGYPQIAYDFEKEKTDEVEDIVVRIIENPTEASNLYKEWFDMPEKWFEESLYSKINIQIHKDAARKNVIFHLTRTNFSILYKFIGIHFARRIMENEKFLETPSTTREVSRSRKFVTCPYDIDIVETRLMLWSNVADVSRNDSPLFLNIIRNSGLLEFLIKEYVTTNRTSPYFAYVLGTLSHLVNAERSHGAEQVMGAMLQLAPNTIDISNTNIRTISETVKGNRRKEQIQRWNYVRLRCLDSGIVKKILRSFCDSVIEVQHIPLEEIQHYLSAFTAFLVQGRDEEERELSEFQFVRRKNHLLRRISAQLKESGSFLSEKVNDDTIENESLHISIVYRCCLFLNIFMEVYHAKGNDYCKNSFFSRCGYDRPSFELLQCYSNEDKHSGSTVKDMDSFELCRQSATHFYKYFTVATARGRSKRSALGEEVQLQWLSLLLNLASTSRISCPTALKIYRTDHIFDQSSLVDDVKIVRTAEGFTKLVFEPLFNNDHKLVVVAAHLMTVNQKDCSYDSVLQDLTVKVKFLRGELIQSHKYKQQMKTWIDQQNTRRKQMLFQSGQAEHIRIDLPEHLSIHPANMEGHEYAITAVFLHSRHLGKTSKRGFDYEIKRKLNKELDEPAAAACMLHVYNQFSKLENRGSFEEVQKFVNYLINDKRSIGNKLQLKKMNPKMQLMMSLSKFSEVLNTLGYRSGVFNGESCFLISADVFLSKREVLEEFAGYFCSFDDDGFYHTLYSNFEEITTSMKLGEQLLPQEFFPQTKNWEYATRLKIGELVEHRKRADERVPLILEYTLVRAEINGKTYQAVFYPEATIACVMQCLLPLAEFPALLLKSTKQPLSEADVLKNVAHYVVEVVVA